MQIEHFDVVVLGGGSGGLVVASVAAQLGYKVALCEGGKMGGDCLNYGCVPSKALLAAAHAAQAVRTADIFGLQAKLAPVDLAKVQAHVREVIAGIAPHDSVERFTGLGVTVVEEFAHFVDAQTVQAGTRLLRGRRLVVATGSRAFVPPIEGLSTVPFLTNETIFELQELPRHLVVVGGGPIGCEMAQAFVRLGSKVTVVEGGAQILGKDDPAMAAVVAQELRAEGVEIMTHAAVKSVRGKAGAIEVQLGEEVVACSHLLIAAGRRPNVEKLNLAVAGIVVGKTGIVVNQNLRTSNKHVFAVGDVAGPYQFTHMAGYQAGIFIARVLFGNVFARVNYLAVPWVTYTDPECAQVGLQEVQARLKFGKQVRVTQFAFAENDRARAEKATVGWVKVITGKRGRVLGASMVGAHAGELIHEWAMAVTLGLTMKQMTGVIHAYPTRAEVNKRVAGEFFKPALFAPLTRRLSRLLFRWLG